MTTINDVKRFNLKFFDEHLIEKIIVAGIIIFSTVCFGALFEQKTWAKVGEISRILLIIAITYYLVIGMESLNTMALSVSLSYLGISIVWLQRAMGLSSPATN